LLMPCAARPRVDQEVLTGPFREDWRGIYRSCRKIF
jgi:hypothetical protein